MLYPELVVTGGGVEHDLGPSLIETVRREVWERARLFAADRIRIESSELREKAPLLGIVALAIARVKQASDRLVHELI